MSFLDSYDTAFEKLKDLAANNLSKDCTEQEEFYKCQKELEAKKIVVSTSEEKLSDSGIIYSPLLGTCLLIIDAFLSA